MNFTKKTISAILFAALLAACGQSATDTASSKAVQTSQTAAISATAAPSELLDSLAKAYPNGQMPAQKMAQAAKELAQNPAVLTLTAEKSTANVQNAKSDSVQPQAVATDYKAVTRIQNTTLTGAYFFTIYDAERDGALTNNPNWKLEGTAFIASVAPDVTLDPVHRFRNKLNGSYLYTIYISEKNDITANYASTFVYEGVAWYARQTPILGWTPLYRFRNLINGTYLFSAYPSEKDAIVTNYSATFKLEGVAYYVQLPNNCVGSRCVQPTRYSLVLRGLNAANEQIYYDKTECVRDNWTGLIWQGQTPAGTGLRANDQLKTNYDSTTEIQITVRSVFNPPKRAPTQDDINATSNSIGFKNAVNATNLCGHNDWRMPTKQELVDIVSLVEKPTVDNYWFPNSANDGYWSSSPYPNIADYAWVVELLNGTSFHGYRDGFNLSRGGQLPNGSSGNFDGYLVRLVR